MNLFGRAKKAPKPKISDRIKELKEAQEMLDKQEAHLEKKMEEARKMALQKSRQKNKKAAIFQLKRKKMFEKRLNQLYGQRENVERLINAMETVAFNKANIEKLKKGKEALAQTIEEVDVDKVNELMDDVNEQVAMADEIGEAMAQTLGNDDIEEEDLEKELEELQNEEMEAEMLQAPEVPMSEEKSEKVEQKQPATVEVKGDILAELASAPSAPVSKPEAKQDKELEAVTASLGI
eukprot:CAMPEP_0170177924 /NCGR_PEP_ID=MMETSP0040_2-20121228/11404_1 /TAXON_ID=641309 /ORGANISM="Lotharella oceanica, Strain CCMP622" /LENGTH=235 /DNA_ID=CAMNT_0010420807 /DNA_START=83 /DNA_END=790 /DNA_ORIENTATION=+